MGGRGQGTATYPDANEDKIRTLGERWTSSLDNEEYSAARSYTGSGYDRMNKRLRSNVDYGTVDNNSIDQRVSALDSAIDKFGLPRNITVYRGASGKSMFGKSLEGMSPEEIKAEFKGAIVNDKGFASTAIRKDYAWSKNVVYEMRVPKGKGKGAYVDTMSSHSGEKEFLIHRNSYWKVTDAYESGYQTVVTLEYVSQAKGEALKKKQ